MTFPNISSELLRTFVSVVDADGFSQAAKRLHKTQSTVSQHVRRLEEEIATTLFQPAGRKRRLTAAGETFYGYARHMLELQETALAAIRRSDLGGQLRLGVTNSLSDGPFTQILARFIRVYPQVQIHVRIGYSAELRAAYERGEFDAAIVIEESGKAMSGTFLEQNQLVWIGPSDFHWDGQNPLPIASFDMPCSFHKATTEALDRARIPWCLVYTTSSVTGLIAAVRAGIAITARTPHALEAGTELVQEPLGLPNLPSYDVVLLRSKAMPSGDILEEILRNSLLKAS